MRPWITRLSVASLAAFLLLGVFLVHTEKPQAGSVVQMYLDLTPAPQAPGGSSLLSVTIPTNCSTWHELFPAFCTDHHQTGYIDNGDGVLSPCDGIELDGNPWHVVWVGPTYFCTCYETPGGPPVRVAAFEPTNSNPSGNPICEIWHEVYPNFCNQMHIDSWEDNGNGVLDECDFVDTQNDAGAPPGTVAFYHIDRIGCNIIVEPGPDTPTKSSTWSNIKHLFEKLGK